MGNRAIVHFISNTADIVAGDALRVPQGFSVYQHWGADDVRQWLAEAAPSMRKGDAGYAVARWIGFLCQQKMPLDKDGRGYSVGMVEEPFDPENGLYVVDCDSGKVTLFREGRGGDLARSGRPFTIKLGRF
jgi:hypothetical protein